MAGCSLKPCFESLSATYLFARAIVCAGPSCHSARISEAAPSFRRTLGVLERVGQLFTQAALSKLDWRLNHLTKVGVAFFDISLAYFQPSSVKSLSFAGFVIRLRMIQLAMVPRAILA